MRLQRVHLRRVVLGSLLWGREVRQKVELALAPYERTVVVAMVVWMLENEAVINLMEILRRRYTYMGHPDL